MKREYLSYGVFVLAALLFFSWGLSSSALAGIPIDSDTIASLAEKLTPTVVNISTTQVYRRGPSPFFGPRGPSGKDPFEEFFRRFFGDIPQQEFKRQSLGSGFIISKDGYIVTNNHVVENASDIKVILSDKTEYHAEVVGRDPKTDIALIKVKTKKDLPAAELGDSDGLRVGEWVVAIGNPFGLGHTVTSGIVSAKGRIIGAGPYDDFIQTDASINPGNSGGPLFDIDGKVVGINTAIISGGQGIGFAIPINMAKSFIPQLREKGSVERGWLGIYIQPVTKELADTFGLKKVVGALVAEVMDNSPAEKGGVKRGDIILEFDGKVVEESSDLPRMAAVTPVGKKVNVKVFREGKRETLSIKMGKLEEKESKVASSEELKEELGLTVQDLTPEIARQLRLDFEEGVIVTRVEQGSLAHQAGMKPRDVILEVNRTKISSVKEFKKTVKKNRKSHLFLVQRGRNTLFVAIKKG